MTYQDYLNAIVKYCECGVSEGRWKELNRPTPGKIKRLCLSRVKSGLSKSDEEFLEKFFEDSNVIDFARKVKNELDRFKPLANFLKNETEKPSDKTLEFLGWLIEFPDRPYNPKFDYPGKYPSSTKTVSRIHSAEPSAGTLTREEDRIKVVAETKEPEGTLKKIFAFFSDLPKRKSIAAGLLFATIGSGAFFTQQAIVGGKKTASGQCMYWNGTKYVLTSCEPKGGDTLVIAADYDKLENFELITRKDTLTSWAVGKFWYLKKDNQIEVFTARGTHPLYPEKSLRKLSKYMFEKHIEPLKKKSLAEK